MVPNITKHNPLACLLKASPVLFCRYRQSYHCLRHPGMNEPSMSNPDIINLRAQAIEQYIRDTTGIELPVTVHAEVASTNDWAIERCRGGETAPFACFARSQTQGRGRRGNSWLMMPDASIAMSLCWVFDSLVDANLLPLTIAMSIVRTLESAGLDNVAIKWPNDVFVADRKIAGILIDAIPLKQKHQTAYIIGVGVNYDMSGMEQQLSGIPYTDICRETGPDDRASDRASDRSGDRSGDRPDDRPGIQTLAQQLLGNIMADCQRYATSSQQALASFRDDYDYCYMKQLEILLDDGRCLLGQSHGVNDEAELCVKVDDEIIHINSAEVSIRVQR